MDGKSFEDLAFQVISTISPLKIPRDEIPFDSVREIVLNELNSGKKRELDNEETNRNGPKTKGRRKLDLDDMDELASTSSSSHMAQTDDEITNGGGGAVSRYTSTEIEGDDDSSNPPRSVSTKLFGNRSSVCSNSSSLHHTSSAPALCFMDTSEKKRPATHRERRLAEMRQARINNYRGEVEHIEFKCDETALVGLFTEYYWKLMNDYLITVPNAFFRLIENLDEYFRTRTWDSNCAKLCSEFLMQSVYKTCQQLTESHDAKDANDEMRIKELMIQVLIGLHAFSFQMDKTLLDDAINKLRLIYITADPQRMRTFLEEPVTDIFLEQIAESIATIYDELCIALPADLAHFDTGFKMNDVDESVLGKRRNGQANKLEQLLAETASEMGENLNERKPEIRRGLKRKSEMEKEHSSPSRRRLGKSQSFKHFFAEDTPDEKYVKIKKEIEEEIDEVVQQTPMAKLRMSANKSGRRCSKRLSELVKLSEERSQIPKRARESMDKMLEKAKAATPLRSTKRTTRSVLFANNTPSPLSTTRSSRVSLNSRFSACSSKPSISSSSTPLAASRRSSIRIQNGSTDSERLSNGAHNSEVTNGKLRLRIKREISDEDEYEEKAGKGQRNSEWSDRRLRSELGLTRDDLNRYRTAMLAVGMKSNVTENGNSNRKKNLDNVQINRAGRVKGGIADDDGVPLFGIKRQSINIFMSHVLLNDSNPDISFDWSKVNFDELNDKPRTRSVQSLRMKPQEYMESLKRKYIESKSNSNSPVKRSSNGSPRKKATTAKRAKLMAPTESNTTSRRSSSIKSEDFLDEYGFEPEAF